MMKIAIIDIIGLPYDGTTVDTQGLGGSESAVTFMAQELAQLDFAVTVFNNCDIDHARPGVYNRVTYRPISDLAQDHHFDIVISSRTIIPFVETHRYPELNDGRAMPLQSYDLYNRIVSQARMRVLWMHDTFCLGDNMIEELAVQNRITDIFTLSDFHLTYVANCNHGRRRNFEVLKNRLFITRNGARCYNNQVNIQAKDPNLFVYNASVTKGMIPLVNDIWPIIKQHIPAARLKVIGGYYRFSAASGPDAQEQDWRRMVADPRYAELGIEFTGVISQREIGTILSQAYMMIYPAAFPETFGISSLESLLYNTPVATCRFGALEEIVPAGAGYHLDYAIEPNSLYPDIDRARQCQLFANMVVHAHANRYLHQQKQYYCNSVRDIAGWDSVAQQWRQHFFKQMGRYLDRDAYRAVSRINHRVHQVWGRRYSNPVEFGSYRSGVEQPIVVVSTFYNAEAYIADCIRSIASQDYDNYQVHLINDASTDGTQTAVDQALGQLPDQIRSRFMVTNNTVNQGAVANQVRAFRAIADPDAIVMIIDGDDRLVNDNTIFGSFNSTYDGTTEFTYGSCWSQVDHIPLISQPYPDAVRRAGAYRQHHFNWILPYTHLRTFRAGLIDRIPDSAFQDDSGAWFRAGGDGSTFYSLIEAADPDRVKCLTDIVYIYNDTNPLNDYKVNGAEQNQTARVISTRSAAVPAAQHTTLMNQPKKKILIAIPTARNIEAETFKSIYDLQVPEGYETHFQYFYGYNIDQVRNLIADWVVRGFDYLFSVDSDIAFAPDTLSRLLAHDVDVVSGLYIQRKPGQHILEVYEPNGHGGVVNIPYGKIAGLGLVPIASCGFGCVLVKAHVMRAIPYPHFKYHSAIDHNHTVSEDVDFCRKATDKGFKLYADATIHCKHIGQTSFTVDATLPRVQVAPPAPLGETRLLQIAQENHLDSRHKQYIKSMQARPRVAYDIGANALEWARTAKQTWPGVEIVAFEAMLTAKKLYEQSGVKHYLGVLSDTDGKEVEFYQNDQFPWGNSYFMENEQLSPPGCEFNAGHASIRSTRTLDSVVRDNNFPKPDLIKIDVQGAEMDVLRGATECLETCTDLIIELQHKEYNKGAPHKEQMLEFLDSIGFELVQNIFLKECDGDYHFKKKVRNVVSRAYILRTSDPRSIEYAASCAESCDKVGLAWEYFDGYENLTQDQLWPQVSSEISIKHVMKDSAACATAGHMKIWQLIRDRKETAIVLEHDALMLHPVGLNIPDNKIVALGYKYHDYQAYDSVEAGAPTDIVDIKRHSGAHAYAITWRTANTLLEEVQRRGVLNAIDNFYFMRINDPGDTETETPLAIMVPTPVICWLRESTIWPDGPSTLNYDVLESFTQFLR
jgi:FkbM family methyltransferase